MAGRTTTCRRSQVRAHFSKSNFSSSMAWRRSASTYSRTWQHSPPFSSSTTSGVRGRRLNLAGAFQQWRSFSTSLSRSINSVTSQSSTLATSLLSSNASQVSYDSRNSTVILRSRLSKQRVRMKSTRLRLGRVRSTSLSLPKFKALRSMAATSR